MRVCVCVCVCAYVRHMVPTITGNCIGSRTYLGLHRSIHERQYVFERNQVAVRKNLRHLLQRSDLHTTNNDDDDDDGTPPTKTT